MDANKRSFVAYTLSACLQNISLLLIIPRPPSSTLFPYTTLFRSGPRARPGFPPGGTCRPRGAGHPVHRRGGPVHGPGQLQRSEEHTSELQSHSDLVCRLLLEKKNSTKLPPT